MNVKWVVERFLLVSFSISQLMINEGAHSQLSETQGRLHRRANALRRKRDLLREEVGTLHLREPEETFRPLLSEGALPRSVLHNYTARDASSEYCGCLNGGWCQEGGVCDCAQFQALGDRCQIIPNQGQDRDGICRSWGQHHYETFDGIYYYYPGTCSYILAQDCQSSSPQYTVWVHNSRVCRGSVYSCPRALSLFFPDEEEIHISGYQVHQGGRRLSLPQTVGAVFIERLADYLLVKSVFGFSLAWDGGSGVYLKMSEDHQGAPCGLCGNFNHVAGDDLTTARGFRTDEPAIFANSWAVDLPHERACPSIDLDFTGPCQSESDMDDAIEKCSALLFFPFVSCHENIDPNPFVASCVSDLCVSDDEDTFCRALVEYTRACSHVGYPVREWRDSFPSCNDGCEESFVHRDCISCCPPTCTFEKECLGTNLHCLDGCYCPDGLILQNGTCIAVSQCPCVYHGTSYTQGHVLEQGCSVCVCMGGVWNCTENNCTAECSVVGDVFMTTFDGRMFLQPGACQYVLAKSRSSSRFTVTLQYTTCAEHQVCIQSVTVVLDEDVSRQVTLTREGEVVVGVNPAPVLPYTDDAVEVRKLTSVVTQLKALGIGLRLQYDGRGGRLYLHLDSHWHRATLGLCGTFNGNLRDDFLSPAGMIEGTPQLHANAWKVSSACVAPVNLPIIDPCEMNQHNLFYASLCEVMLGSVFEPCHGYVSPSVYNQQCRYQACRCGQSCLCTALAHYAYLCAKHGVDVNFRPHVSECGVVCLGGMLYHSCISSCGRSCRALSSSESCDEKDCAEGCGCSEGTYYDDARQRCVLLSQCHCYSMGGVFQPEEVTFSAAGPCLCRNGKLECVQEDREPEMVETGECPEGKVYHSCAERTGGVACEPTCRNLMLNLTCPPNTPCISGCVCPPGLVLHRGECYYPENCPCVWMGLEYLPGETVETPCYRCACHHGFFNCSYSPCPAVCTVYSDRHYHTFDGLEYDYYSDCQVYLLKSIGEAEVSVVAQNKDCYESGIVCMKILVIHVGLTKIYFTDNSGNPSPSTVLGRGSEFELWNAGYYTVVHFASQDITILWDRKTTVHIRAGPQWKGLLRGLCGNFDTVTVNDMTTSSHMEVNNAQSFGDSWALGQCVSDYVVKRPCEGDLGRQPYAKRECAILYSDIFAPCHNVVDVAWFYRNCLTDTCNCNRGGDCECLCTSIAAYAHKCCQQGVGIHWRSPTVCPFDCEYYNQELGDGPYAMFSAIYNDTMFGVNRSSSLVFPLTRPAPGRLPAPGLLFNFMVTTGLQKDPKTRVPMVSLESAERPNYFLTVSGRSRLQMERWSRGPEFSRRATFIQHQGLFLPGHTSFELITQPGIFLTLTRTAVRAQKYQNSEDFKTSSSFTLEESSFLIPYRMFCEWRYQTCASPCVPTCSDPDATLCHFLPLVEGCFPRCPKNMLMDEITRRCVYAEDCVVLPPTPTPFSYVTRSNRTTTAPPITTPTPVRTTTSTTRRPITSATSTTTRRPITSTTITRRPITSTTTTTRRPITSTTTTRRPITSRTTTTTTTTRAITRFTTTPSSTRASTTRTSTSTVSPTIPSGVPASTARITISPASSSTVTTSPTIPLAATVSTRSTRAPTASPAAPATRATTVTTALPPVTTTATVAGVTTSAAFTTLTSSTTVLASGLSPTTAPSTAASAVSTTATTTLATVTTTQTTPAGPTPAGQTPAGPTPAGPTPAGQTPAGPTPAGQTPAGPTPAGQTPARPTPAGQTPARPTPARPTPAGQTPARPTPARPTPAGQTPARPTPAGPTSPTRPVRPGDITTTTVRPPVDTTVAVTTLTPTSTRVPTTTTRPGAVPATSTAVTTTSARPPTSTGPTIADTTSVMVGVTTRPTAPGETTESTTTEPTTTELLTSPETSPITTEELTTTPLLLPTGACTPPYSFRIDECAELICFNSELLLHNSSLHCRYNTTMPQCSLLGLPILTNTDPCCPQWQCPCRCSVMSDLRVITFDGNNVALYDNGSYILVTLPRETIIGTVDKCPFSQSVNSIRRSSPTGGNDKSLCFIKLNITTSSYRIIINRLDRKVLVNYRPARLPFSRHALSVDDTGSMYLINTPGGVNIQWYHSTGIMVLQYTTGGNGSAPTQGLCGCCDGNPADDLKLPNGTVIRELSDMRLFLSAWRVHTLDETEHMRRIGDNCTTGDCSTCLTMLRQRPFTLCHGKVAPEQFCDIMWAGDLHYKDHKCDFLAAYVAVCYTHQICITWRRRDFCPLRCPAGKEYKPCVSTCASRTCLNREYYEETTCSFIREECVCRAGTILHRADSPFCITEDRCVCTDNEGNPRGPGEVWNGSARSCCLYQCMENGSVVAVEPDCGDNPTPLCEREGEYVLDVVEEGACCPKKICECNMTICDSEAPPCDHSNHLVIGYSALSCCPEYRCECDPMACPHVTAPDCREDQFLVEVREDRSCCYSYLCVCESCIEPIPTCGHGEILAVDLNTTSSCCPQYHCVCDVNMCPGSSVSCAPGLTLVQTPSPGQCCPQQTCECQCEDSSLPACQVGELLVEVPDSSVGCGCPRHACQKLEVCVFQGVTVLNPGQSLIQYFEGELCYTVLCLQQRDTATGFYAMEISSVNCTQKCGSHQVYVVSSDPQVCCGACKNVSCSFTDDNGTTEVFASGSSWVDNCTRYDCMETAVGAVVLASGVICPPFNDTECIQNGGVVQRYVDGCCKTCSGVGALPFTVNPVTPTGSTNCDTGKEDGKTCKRVAIRTTIRKDDCRSNAPVTVYSCDGKCPSATIFNFNINSHARFCKCCRESGLQTRTVTLYCSRNSTLVDYNFQEPLDCSCQWN